MSVLLPLPFSPTRNVTPSGTSIPPSRMICATAGIVYGQLVTSTGGATVGPTALPASLPVGLTANAADLYVLLGGSSGATLFIGPDGPGAAVTSPTTVNLGGGTPAAIAVNPVTGHVAVAYSASGSAHLLILDRAGTTLSNFAIGYPGRIAVDTGTNRFYVANTVAKEVVIVQDA